MSNLEFALRLAAGFVALGIAAYHVGRQRGMLEATRQHTRKVDDMLSRWRSEQRP